WMQLHVVAEQLPEGSQSRPAVDHVLQVMSQVIEEGRNTLRALRPSIGPESDLKTAFSRIPEDIGSQQEGEFRVVVEGVSLPLRPVIRDDVYSIGREALVNAFRHSRAKNIQVQLEYGNEFRVVVQDDGCGIDPRVLQSGGESHWGLSRMRERAQRIGAKLKVLSRSGGGTEVELRIPRDVAFAPHPAKRGSTWLNRLYRSRERVVDSIHEKQAR